MAKVHFFKLAQELGERPVELQKKLNAEGILVRSTSTMLDDETALRIREYVRQNAAAQSIETPAAPAPAPVKAAAPPAQIPAAEPAPAPPAPAAPAAPAPAAEEHQPVTRVIKRIPQGEVRPGQAPPQHKPKKRGSLLITPEADGGLSAEAEFGIVKPAGAIPIPQVVRPPRPPRREEGPAPAGGPPRGPRPEGVRPPSRGPMTPPAAAAPDMTGKGAAKPAAKGTDAKKKQKRTVFGDKEKEKPRTGLRTTGAFTATTFRSRRKRRDGGKRSEEAAVLEGPIIITGAITVGDLAERALLTPAQVITQLIGMGVMATVNQQIEPDQAMAVLEKLEIEALLELDLVEQASWRLTATSVGIAVGGAPRPPVVTILGHVDHGKTTLLDSIRKTNVTAQEFGGITQHIGAYQVTIKDQKITFLDTPGHAAFTAMRARGANLTDIAVLVVAADDGIQPQTVEAIDHAKAAKVPIIVAINKIDVPDAQPDAVKQQLTSYGLVSEEWGGDTIMVQLSAKKAVNIDQLLEMILLVAEVQELHAVTDKPARGAVVETKLDKQRGPVATILVQEGTLRVGDSLVIGMVAGKVRAMTNDKGQPITEAGPSMPVEITGLSDVPVAGDLFEVVDDDRKARDIAEQRQMKAREERLATHVSLHNLKSLVASGVVKDLNLILKTDVAGSIEAISQVVGQVEHEEIRVNIIHAGVGDVTESDVLLASASEAIIVGFHVRIEAQARALAEEAGIDVRIYQVIYDLVDDIKKSMVGMLAPIFEESILGHAQVRAIFKISRLGTIAGCYVIDGQVRRGSKIRVLRGGEVIHQGNLDSLKHIKEDVREMNQGFECGISLDRYNDWQEGDVIESYVMKELRRETL